MKYQFIQEHRGECCLQRWCSAMEVSVSSYYAWQKRPASEREKQNERIVDQIKAVHQDSEQTYGSPRVHTELRAQGRVCSLNRVARLMQLNSVWARRKRKFTRTTDSEHALPVAPNELDRNFGARQADQKWVADITYVWTRQGWLYLAVVLDLFSRKVVGWAMQPNLERGLVLAALQMALLSRRPGQGLLHHSDRGSQYASGDYQQLLKERKVSCSMSRKGNCWDNAPMESFFATLKLERVHRRQYRTRQEARQDIFHYIEVWYNRKRRHSSLGYLSPEEFERQQEQVCQQQKKAAQLTLHQIGGNPKYGEVGSSAILSEQLVLDETQTDVINSRASGRMNGSTSKRPGKVSGKGSRCMSCIPSCS